MKDKKVDYYIPIGKTLLNVKNMPDIQCLIPPKRTIIEHISVEKQNKEFDKRYQYRPMVVEADKEIYDKLILQIKRKQKLSRELRCIDIIVQPVGLPVLQIVPKRELINGNI